MNIVLGIDTSCYYTSAALVSDGKVLYDERIPIAVAKGERGLRQSDAVFEHIRTLPKLLDNASHFIKEHNLTAVCASGRPCNAMDSYMPVFVAGENMARAAAAAAGVPVFISDHQSGHIMSGLWSSEFTPKNRFLAVHLSGGTTQVLAVDPSTMERELIGGSADLHLGQLIDRVGVALGYAFPAGRYIDKLAIETMAKDIGLATSVRGTYCNLSGLENAALALMDKSKPDEIALTIMSAITRTLDKLLYNCSSQTGIADILIIGGVAASLYIREHLNQRMEKQGHHVHLHFGHARYSGDNAIGIALIGESMLKGAYI